MNNISGIIIGLSSFLIIGIFHPVVIKCEYYFGAKVWPVFLFFGIVSLIISLMIKNDIFSGIMGVFGFCLLWSIRELKEQEKRVLRGWFPKNPKRQ